MAKHQGTYAKRSREVEKRRKADAKRQKRSQRRPGEGGETGDAAESQPHTDGTEMTATDNPPEPGQP